jgi:ABC-type sugar transport system ATPase subunit
MDEPIAHLDAKLRHHMRGELKKLQEKLGVTTLLATPDYHEVVAMADRAAILSHGRIEQIGTPIELYSEPQNVIVANSIGDPPINLLDCVIEKKGDTLSLVGDGFSITCGTVLGEKIARQGTTDGLILGVRPNDMALEKDSRKGLIETEVYVFEPLGGEAVATLSLGAKRIKVVCPWEERLKIGDKVGVNFSAESIHLFDKDTGKALPGQASQNPQRKEVNTLSQRQNPK